MIRKERAITNLKQMCSDGRYLGSGSYVPLEVLEDFDLAIKALERGSRKCIWIKHDYRSICPQEHTDVCDGSLDKPYWRVPENMKEVLRYCPYCGKEIEMEE